MIYDVTKLDGKSTPLRRFPGAYRGDAYGRYSGISDVRFTERFQEGEVNEETSFGAFARVFREGSDWMLQGGHVLGADSSEVEVSALNIGNVGSEPADDTHYWLRVMGNGVIADGYLQGGFEVTSASGTSTEGSNVVPTHTSSSGTVYISLGTWYEERFYPALAGNLNVAFCPPGSFIISRF